ncbi:Fructosamine kinase-domain-containing protein [Aspergillus stella-maris]|uniref:Fructosamine kinase-domain-containing protein n=1 Tax=Aspergillus stella-maris TaxID=1810926 RepID=UPI003CCCE2C2
MTDASIWDQEIAVPENVISFVDDHVLAKLPIGLTVVGIYPHGASYWTRTAEIKTTNARNDAVSFFLKVSQGDIGKGMMHGEYHSMTALHSALSELVPKPIAWGTYNDDPDTHFFLCHFHTMTDDIPDIADFPGMVAQLHKNGVSPNGKFGFPVTTYQGRLAQATKECDTWEESFSSGMEQFFKAEEEAQGPDEEMTELRRGIMETVIPRLLRPLETGGRKVIPRLIHGDLWDGNTSVDAATGLPIIFDACSSYAHHEYELAPWRPRRHKIGKPYVTEYLKHFPMSEPAADFDDRNSLYCVRFNLCSSALYPGNLRFRNIVKEEMRELVDKFC